jgi:hypothetical protein
MARTPPIPASAGTVPPLAERGLVSCLPKFHWTRGLHGGAAGQAGDQTRIKSQNQDRNPASLARSGRDPRDGAVEVFEGSLCGLEPSRHGVGYKPAGAAQGRDLACPLIP